MKSINNNALFTDLTEAETNELNGGAYCFIRTTRVLIRRGWLVYYAIRRVWVCY